MTYVPWSFFAQDILDLKAAIARDSEDRLRADAEWKWDALREAEAERKSNEEEE